MDNFNQLEIKAKLQEAVLEMGFTAPTPVQREVIPIMLTGKDVLAQAPTGTGKTCAFAIPIVNAIDEQENQIQALVVCPTRELVLQTEKEFKKLAKNMQQIKVLAIYGGQNFQRQLAVLRKKPQIIIATPGRLLDHMQRKTIKLENVKTVVLDEADEMLSMGFIDDIDKILRKVAKNSQTVMFSATVPNEILLVSRQYQKSPEVVKIKLEGSDIPPIKQHYLKLKESTKLRAFVKIMQDNNFESAICFCNTKRKVDIVANMLAAKNISTAALHGDLRQNKRDQTMKLFRTKQVKVLVATDVAARGIDVDNVEAVFNYDIPNENEYYIHRIGRTARAQRKGSSFTFATGQDFNKIALIEKHTKTKMQELELEGITLKQFDAKSMSKFILPAVRYIVNLGYDDEIDEDEILELLTCGVQANKDAIQNIKVNKTNTIIEVEKFSDGFITSIDKLVANDKKVTVKRYTHEFDRKRK